jgi:hypothetical protein
MSRKILHPTSIFIVPHGGYPFDVMVCIGASDAEIRAELAARGIEDPGGKDVGYMRSTGRGYCRMLPGGQTVLALKNFSGTPEDHSHLAHEVFHAVESLMRRVGIELSKKSDEAFAYAIGGLTRSILEQLALPPSKRSVP